MDTKRLEEQIQVQDEEETEENNKKRCISHLEVNELKTTDTIERDISVNGVSILAKVYSGAYVSIIGLYIIIIYYYYQNR